MRLPWTRDAHDVEPRLALLWLREDFRIDDVKLPVPSFLAAQREPVGSPRSLRVDEEELPDLNVVVARDEIGIELHFLDIK